MPSPRSSPALRPQSPLSPRYEAPSRFEHFRPPSPRSVNTRTGNTSRRANANTLKLPALPRYHPSNFPSGSSSVQTTPDSPTGSPQAPVSPRTHHRVISDAQRQLFAYQREMMAAVARSSTPTQLEKPVSPRLVPMGSPGPVTPLELECEDDGYLAAGSRNAAHASVVHEELMERLMKEEVARMGRTTNGSPSRQAAL